MLLGEQVLLVLMSILYRIALFLWVEACDTSSIIVPRGLPYLFIIFLWRTVTFIGIVSHSLWRPRELVSIDSIALKEIGLPVHLNFEGNVGGVIACKSIAVLRVFKSLRLSWHGVTEILWHDLRLPLWLLETGPDPWPGGFLINKEFKDLPFYGPQPNTFLLIHGWWQLPALPLLKSALNSRYKRNKTATKQPWRCWLDFTNRGQCLYDPRSGYGQAESLTFTVWTYKTPKHTSTGKPSQLWNMLLCLYIPCMWILYLHPV